MKATIGRRNILVIIFIFFISFMFHVTPISAAVWDINATSLYPTILSDFSFQCDDDNNDKILLITELTSFSGVDLYGTPTKNYDKFEVFADQVIGSVETSDGTGAIINSWTFSRLSGTDKLHGTSTSWTYSATAVPIPGAVWLLGSGLIGIVGIRKKFKK